jgi:hypothetical protein
MWNCSFGVKSEYSAVARGCAGVVLSGHVGGIFTMKTLGLLTLALTAASAFAQGPAPSKLTLKEGDMAPDFTIAARMNTSSKEIKLSDFRGKKNVILAFFPAAFTGG